MFGIDPKALIKPLIKNFMPKIKASIPKFKKAIYDYEKSVQLLENEDKVIVLIWIDHNQNKEIKGSVVTIDEELQIKRVIETVSTEEYFKMVENDQVFEMLEKNKVFDAFKEQIKDENSESAI